MGRKRAVVSHLGEPATGHGTGGWRLQRRQRKWSFATPGYWKPGRDVSRGILEILGVREFADQRMQEMFTLEKNTPVVWGGSQ